MQSTDKPKQKPTHRGGSLFFSAGLLLAMVLVTTAFEWKFPYQLVTTPITPEEIFTEEELDFKPVTLRMPKPKTPSPDIIEVEKERAETIEKPVPDLLPPDEGPETPAENLIDDLLNAGTPFGEEEAPEADFSREAAPAGGYDAFYAYLYKNLRVPAHLLEQSGEKRLVVSFVIDTNGSITDITIAEGLDKGLEKQVIALLKKGPAWEPAWQSGRKVKVRKALPIVIKSR